MPPKVDTNKCNGCNGRAESCCEQVCPGDLMLVSAQTGKAICRNPRECWDCMSCVKACPRGALETKMPYQLGYFKATLRPYVGKNFITWKCRDINGNEQTFKSVNRTT
ncbi:MAG: 4Fe-4S binding protein [Mailhella sp.]|nr:4Fe-4S binding protein [Mailhella sp.]